MNCKQPGANQCATSSCHFTLALYYNENEIDEILYRRDPDFTTPRHCLTNPQIHV